MWYQRYDPQYFRSLFDSEKHIHTHTHNIHIETNPILSAATFGRLDNVKFWLNKFPDWNLEKEDETGEGAALARAITFGPHRLELVRFLLKSGARVDAVSKRRGMTLLMFASANEDADARLLSVLLQNMDSKRIEKYVNMHSRSRSFTHFLFDLIHRRSGRTAIHYAVSRGDIEIVETLLASGADPTRRDWNGQSSVSVDTTSHGGGQKGRRRIRFVWRWVIVSSII